mgnify:CR=1 FL=1
MTLREFVTKFVERNTCCRLWIRKEQKGKLNDHQLVFGSEYLIDDIWKYKYKCFMEWELLTLAVPQSNYLDCTFISITAMNVDGFVNGDSIDLIIKDDNVKDYYQPKKENIVKSNNIVEQECCYS